MTDPEISAAQFIDRARKLYEGYDGDIEIDDNAVISRNDSYDSHGAFVQAWVWVPNKN